MWDLATKDMGNPSFSAPATKKGGPGGLKWLNGMPVADLSANSRTT